MAETQVEVTVYRRGAVVDTVTRPLRQLDGKPAVTYRRQLHVLVDGHAILLDGVPPPQGLAPQVSEPQETSGPKGSQRDPLQVDVIEAPPDARLLVDAGPGTGKTAVACNRVAWLIQRHDLQPSKIWLISFTRTAVKEIRDRIARVLGDQEAAFAVKIATLDSHAWALHSGFDETAKLTGSYEQNLENVLELLQQNAELADYLETIEHLIVDETQDVVGIRAELVAALISRLPKSCGVTVFADQAQAIYGFAEDDEAKAARTQQPPLTERLRKSGLGFADKSLKKVFRTSSPHLLKLFTDTRTKVLATSENPANKLKSVRQEIQGLAHGSVPELENQNLEKAEDLFVLFRRRVEVLIASSLLNGSGVRHRIRMAGMPACIPAWVGACLGEHVAPMLTRTDFLALWKQRVARTPCEILKAEEAWALLWRHAGKAENVIEMRRLRAILGRAQPPADCCTSELGTRGPIIGTIHASKGREASTVHLMIPPSLPGEDADLDEETRVVFVGATRAKATLKVGHGFSQFATKLESGRTYTLHSKKGKVMAQVEIGRDGDVSAESVASRSLYRSAEQVREVQAALLRLVDTPAKAKALCNRDADFTYMLVAEEGGALLGALTASVNSDLFKVADAVRAKAEGGKRRPPDEIWHLHVVGVRTEVLLPDSPEAQRLHAPWSTSGIVLAPIILGYTTMPFPYYRR